MIGINIICPCSTRWAGTPLEPGSEASRLNRLAGRGGGGWGLEFAGKYVIWVGVGTGKG